MKFEFDSQNPTELRAVEAAVAVLVSGLTTPERLILEDVVEKMKDLPGAVVSDDGLTVTGSGAVETIRVDTLEVATSINVIETTNLMSEERTYQDAQTGAETDSAGQPWDADLHSSSRAKIADGTWKKRRNTKPADPQDVQAEKEMNAAYVDAAKAFAAETPTAPLPPAPPVPAPEFSKRALAEDGTHAGIVQASELVTMNQIWALITNNQATLNDVLAAAQRMGFADLGAVAQTATNEQRAALLKELTV